MKGPRVIKTKPTTVAFIAMHGAYAQVPEGLGKLYSWVGAHRLRPTGMPTAVYFTAPAETLEDEALWELRAPVRAKTPDVAPDDAGIGVKHVEPLTVASVMHIGPYESIPPTYEMLWRWVEENGYVPDGPPMELYYSDPAKVPPEKYRTEVQLPVRPA